VNPRKIKRISVSSRPDATGDHFWVPLVVLDQCVRQADRRPPVLARGKQRCQFIYRENELTPNLTQFELKNSYGYKAEGVKFGDADKVLFWYRKKGAEKYRAIFGDLHADDVTADRLPEKPKF
jgi:hypothetical protein